MRDGEKSFKSRPRHVLQGPMDPIMLPSNGPIMRGVVPYYSDEECGDVIEDNIRMFGGNARDFVATRVRGTSRLHNTRSRKGQGDLVDLTEAKNESGNLPTDSDRPPANHPQDLRTRIDAEGKATEEPPRNYKRENSPTKATNAAATILIGNTALNYTSLPDDQEPKFLSQARHDYPSVRPPFARLNRYCDVLGTKRVTFATPDGQLPQREIPATLAIRAWDSKSSFYTLDIGGERLIVKAMGGNFKLRDQVLCQYRAWSGQGDTYASVPVAFGLREEAGDQDSTGKDSDDNLESYPEDVVVHTLDTADDADYIPSSSEGSSPKNESERASSFQQVTRETNSPEIPATRAPLTHLNTSHDDQATRDLERSSIELEPEHRPGFATLQSGLVGLSEASAAAPRTQEASGGKRQAPDLPEDDRSSKKGRPQPVARVRIPPTLTIRKQDRTVLFISLPGTVSDMAVIKLSSAMSISTLFSSVCSAAGIKEYVNLAIAIVLEREDGGPERSMIIKRNSVETFEIFLEAVDEAPCWREEGGRLSLRVHLKSLVEVEMAMRM